jgi:hypothetical protein
LLFAPKNQNPQKFKNTNLKSFIQLIISSFLGVAPLRAAAVLRARLFASVLRTSRYAAALRPANASFLRWLAPCSKLGTGKVYIRTILHGLPPQIGLILGQHRQGNFQPYYKKVVPKNNLNS